MSRTGSAWMVVLAACLAAGDLRAAAPEAEQRARHSFERAEASFKAGLFAEALAGYQEGYDHLPLPGFLINMAQCHRRLGNLEQARATYRKFIMVAPDSPYVPEVKSLVAELDSLVSGEAADAAQANQAAAGDGRRALGPAPVVAAVLAAEPATTPNALVTPADLAEPPRARTRWWLWGTVGVAVAAGAAATFYLLTPPGTTTVHEGSLGTLRR
jgi:tetratricopeptide (TPR) repeat protein